MKIKDNTSVVDLSFNLFGSLTGLPVIVNQLPVGDRIGFNNLPKPWEDVSDIGQTWTPDLAGRDLEISAPKIYNVLGQQKAPYTTNLFQQKVLYGAEDFGTKFMRSLNEPVSRIVDLPEFFDARGLDLNVTTRSKQIPYLDIVPGTQVTENRVVYFLSKAQLFGADPSERGNRIAILRQSIDLPGVQIQRVLMDYVFFDGDNVVQNYMYMRIKGSREDGWVGLELALPFKLPNEPLYLVDAHSLRLTPQPFPQPESDEFFTTNDITLT